MSVLEGLGSTILVLKDVPAFSGQRILHTVKKNEGAASIEAYKIIRLCPYS